MSRFGLTSTERIRVDAIDRHVARGAAAVAELVAMLCDPSWTVRRAVVAGLAALGDDAVAPLAEWLRVVRTDEHGIAAVVDALAASTGERATTACIALLADPMPAVASDAAQILGRRRAAVATPMLARAVAHADDNVAVAAIEALGAIGGAGTVEALVGVLAQRRFFRTFPALQVLVRMGDPRVVAPITALLADESYRFEAARALGRAGFAQAIAPLASLLPGAGDAVVRLVGLALADLLERAAWTGAIDHVVATMRAVIGPALPRFIAALRRADTAERAAIAAVLGRIGDASAVPELVRLLDDAEVRDAAVAAIQRLSHDHDEALLSTLRIADPAVRAAVLPGVSTERAVPQVRGLLTDEDPEIRARACEALARLGDTTAVPALFAALADDSPRVAHAAMAAIHSLGATDTATRTIEALRSGSSTVRRHALRIVAYMGFNTAFDALVEATTDDDPRICELAVAAFAMLTEPRAQAILAQLGRDPREGVRAATMRALVHRGADAAPQLTQGLRDDAAWVRYYAVQGLGRLGDARTTGLVIERLADAAPFVRIAAIEALGHLAAPAAWQALCSVVRSSDPDEHRAALASMGLVGDQRALPFLLEGAGADDLATQLIALTGLARRSEPEALAALVVAALGDTPDARDAALSLLGDRTDAPAASALVRIALAMPLEHPAQLTLSRPGAARVAAILGQLPAADEHGAARLIGALARLGDVPALASALTLASATVRRAAASALVSLGDTAALGSLATDDPDLGVRQISASVVRR